MRDRQPDSYAVVLARRVKTTAMALAIAVVVGGLLALLGWTLETPQLKSGNLGLVTMKANTAFLFVLTGICMSGVQRTTFRWGESLSVTLAALIVLISAVALSQFFVDFDAGIDQLIFHDATDAVQSSHAGRMSPSTALCFPLTGTAVIALRPSRPIVAQSMTATVSLIAVEHAGTGDRR